MSTAANPSSPVVDDAGFPPGPPEAHQQAGLQPVKQPAITNRKGVPMSKEGTQNAADTTTDASEAQPAMSAGGEAAEYVELPARSLSRHPLNVRKSGGEDVTELKALILAQGLLQNLVIAPLPKQRRGAIRYGVVAGGRRLKAILQLIHEGLLPKDYVVRCRVITHAQAVAASTAENVGREPMTLPDIVRAFADMHADGVNIDDLALCFGITPLTVQRRLRLAGVAPDLLALVGEGKMTQAQLEALALSDDHDTQLRVWNTTPGYQRSPDYLRRLIAGQAVDARQSAIAKYVTLAAYEAAGGEVLRDLFLDEDAGRITNHELLQRLALKKLERKAQKVAAKGCFPWVETRLELSHSDQRTLYRQPPTVRRAPAAAQAAEIAEARAALSAAEAACEQFRDRDDCDDDGASDQAQALEEALEKAAQRLDELQAALVSVPDEVMALVGAVVYIDSKGNAATLEGVLRAEDFKRASTVAAAAQALARTAQASDGTAADGQEPQEADASLGNDEPGLSRALASRLAANKTLALQAELARRPQLALATVVHALLRGLDRMRASYEPTCLTITASDCSHAIALADNTAEASPAFAALSELQARCDEVLPREPGELLTWLASQPVDVLLNLLAYCAARSVTATDPNGNPRGVKALATLVNLDMATWWQPTAASFFAHVSKAQIADVVSAVCGAEHAKGLAVLKKQEAAARAEELLQGSRWLPEPLRS